MLRYDGSSEMKVATKGKLDLNDSERRLGGIVSAPDSRRLGFVVRFLDPVARWVSGGEGYVLEVDSGELLRLVPATGGGVSPVPPEFQWSPDGRQIAVRIGRDTPVPRTDLE